MQTVQEIEARAIAAQAIRTVPDLHPEVLHSFLVDIGKREPVPIARFRGVPIWRYTADLTTLSSLPEAELATVAGNDHLVFQEDHICVCLRSDPQSLMVVVPMRIVGAIMEDRGFTPASAAEMRLAAQLLSGVSLNDAAAGDNVAYETKRNQFKSLAAKMGLSRQQDVVRILLQDLLLIVVPRSTAEPNHDLLYGYKDRFLPDRVRLSILSQRDGPDARILDYGPVSGRPVLLLHPMILPDITDANINAAEAEGIRVILPLRPGLLDPSAASQSHEAHMDQAFACLVTAWTQMCGTSAALLALVSSGALATRFARSFPDRVSSVTYAATCFSSGHYRPSPIYFGSSVAELALRNEWILTKTMATLRRQFFPRDKFEPTIRRIFSGSAPDTRILEREFDVPNHGDRIMAVVLQSPESLKQDYFNQVHFDWKQVADVSAPVEFVHGLEDSIHAVCDMERLRTLAGNRPMRSVPGVGHLFQYDQLDQLIADVAAATPR